MKDTVTWKRQLCWSSSVSTHMKTMRYVFLKVVRQLPQRTPRVVPHTSCSEAKAAQRNKPGQRSMVTFFLYFSSIAWFSGTACHSSGINKFLPWFKSGWHPRNSLQPYSLTKQLCAEVAETEEQKRGGVKIGEGVVTSPAWGRGWQLPFSVWDICRRIPPWVPPQVGPRHVPCLLVTLAWTDAIHPLVPCIHFTALGVCPKETVAAGYKIWDLLPLGSKRMPAGIIKARQRKRTLN